jgi:hypothetical protein
VGYKKPFTPPKVTVTCNILNHTPMYSISYLAYIVVHHNLCFTEHVDETISTEDGEYGLTWYPLLLTTTP